MSGRKKRILARTSIMDSVKNIKKNLKAQLAWGSSFSRPTEVSLFDVLLPRTAIHPNTEKTEKYPHAFSHSIKFNAMLKNGHFPGIKDICGKKEGGGKASLKGN